MISGSLASGLPSRAVTAAAIRTLDSSQTPSAPCRSSTVPRWTSAPNPAGGRRVQLPGGHAVEGAERAGGGVRSTPPDSQTTVAVGASSSWPSVEMKIASSAPADRA